MARATLRILVLSTTLAGSGCMSLARGVARSVAEDHAGAPQSGIAASHSVAGDQEGADAAGRAAVYRHGPTYGWVDRPPAASLARLFGPGAGDPPPAALCGPIPVASWGGERLPMRIESFRFPRFDVRSTRIALGGGSGFLEPVFATDPDVPARHRPSGPGLSIENTVCDAAFHVTLWIGLRAR